MIRQLLSLCLGALIPVTCLAAPIRVTFSDATVPAGGGSSIDVFVEGDGDLLNTVGFEFRIAPIGGTTSTLSFSEEFEGYLGDANYLFTANSAAQRDGADSSVGSVLTTVLPNDTFVGGDGSADFTSVNLSESRLLARLQLIHSTGPADPATTIGHEFSIFLEPLSGDSTAFLAGTSNSGFLDANALSFESVQGSITIVPEPSGLSLLAIALFACRCFISSRPVSQAGW